MKRFMKLLSIAMFALAILGAYAPAVSASHEGSIFVASRFTKGTEHWIDLLSSCGGSVSYSPNTLLFVSNGWAAAPWHMLSPEEARGFMSEATTFTFLLDGQLQHQSRIYQYYKEPDPTFGVPDLMAKGYNTEYHDGLTGSHIFTGQFFLDASLLGGSFGEPVLVFECTVNFVA